MTSPVTIALDAMGGDDAPAIVVDGARMALAAHPDTRFLMFGDSTLLEPMLSRGSKLAAACTVHHTDQSVSNQEKPATALRGGRQSSMRLAINAVGDGSAGGVVSAGNTGALMAMSKFVLKTLPGIERPSLASFFPTKRGDALMLDLGANVDCDAENLVQFAIMGEVYARIARGIEHPTVGLLNVGVEDMKGHKEIREARDILRDIDLPMRFHGFIEGDDIAKGTVDVVVTDGFSGNIALKTAEGVVSLFASRAKDALHGSLLAKLAYFLASPALAQLRDHVDSRRRGGAMFLGLNGITVKAHGSTDALGFSNAIGMAIDLVGKDVNTRIIEEFERFSANNGDRQTAVL